MRSIIDGAHVITNTLIQLRSIYRLQGRSEVDSDIESARTLWAVILVMNTPAKRQIFPDKNPLHDE